MIALPRKSLNKGVVLAIITFTLGSIVALILAILVDSTVGYYVEAVVAMFSLSVIFIPEILKDWLREELLREGMTESVTTDGMKKIYAVKEKIKSKRFTEAFDDAIISLEEGKIKLNEKEMFRFWAELHTPNDVIFFRCTSSISPETWNNPYMQQYERRQIENIKEYNKKTEKTECMTNILNLLSGFDINGHNFERIFIVDDKQLEDNKLLDELAQRIERQLPHMTIKVVRTSQIAASDYEDFGIVFTEKCDKFVMCLEILADRSVGGGWISFDDEVINRYMKAYRTIQNTCPVPIKKEASSEDIKMIIRETELRGKDIFTNRCLECYFDTEKKIKSNEWQNLPVDNQIWYKINVDENNAIKKILNETRPQKVLEVGCGPGRVVQMIFDLCKTCKKIVGIEQNKEIYEYAYERFDKPKFQEQVVIMQRLIEKSMSVPFDDDCFDLVIDSSNLVGWQEDEIEWLNEMIRVSKVVYFSVYKKGKENERMKMYETRGDLVEIDENRNIILKNVDAFGRKAHATKSYTKENVEKICKKITKDYDVDSTSCDFMFFCTLRKGN